MKGNKTGLFGQLNGNAFILLASILLMSPASSSSVLCIAPGDHVAIEDLDAGCCASSAIAAKEDRHSVEFDTATHCRNCTDLFITPNERGPIPKSIVVAAGSPAGDCSANPLFEIIFAHLSLQHTYNEAATPKSASSSVPLRC